MAKNATKASPNGPPIRPAFRTALNDFNQINEVESVTNENTKPFNERSSVKSYEIIPNGSAKSPVPTFPFKMCINTPRADVPSCPFRGLLFRGASIRSSRFNFRLKF